MTTGGLQRLQNAAYLFFMLFVFFSTFSIAGAQMSLGVSLVLFIAYCLAAQHNPFTASLKWVYLLVVLYVSWLLLSSVVGPTPVRSVLIAKEEWLFTIIPLGVFLFGRATYRSWSVTVLAVGILLVSVYTIIQHFTGINLFKNTPLKPAPDHGYLACGGFSHPLTLGNYFGTASAFLLGYVAAARKHLPRPVTLLLMVSTLLGAVATVLSYSRAAIVALAIVFVVVGVSQGRRYLALSLGVVAVLAAAIIIALPGLSARFTGKTSLDLGGEYEGGRVFVWKNSVKVIREHPVFGVGVGNFQAAYTAHLRPDIPDKRKLTHAHNDLLNIAAISGVPGAVFFAGMWLVVITCLYRGWRRTAGTDPDRGLAAGALLGSVVFLITSLFEATFGDEEVRQLLMFIWAAGLWTLYNHADEPDRRNWESA